MIPTLTVLLAFATLAASVYVSVVCFCVIHRMSRRTSWALWSAVAATSAMGARGFLESVSFIAAGEHVSPVTAALTIAAAGALLLAPRINTESNDDGPRNPPLAGHGQ